MSEPECQIFGTSFDSRAGTVEWPSADVRNRDGLAHPSRPVWQQVSLLRCNIVPYRPLLFAASQHADASVHQPLLLKEAVDSDGRRRFHGAFTGGFSAGYFNSVGSKDGWAPAAYTSSRTQRSKEGSAAKPSGRS